MTMHPPPNLSVFSTSAILVIIVTLCPLKIPDSIEINCKVADVPSPDWNEMWKQLYERVIEKTDQNPVKVEKSVCRQHVLKGV